MGSSIAISRRRRSGPGQGGLVARVFERLGLELSGYYILSFEPEAGDRDGKPHKIAVTTPNRGGVTIRARREFVVGETAMRTAEDMQSVAGQFDNLAKAVLEAAGADVVRPAGSASFTLGDADGYVPLEGLIDREAELARKLKERENLIKHIRGAEAKLGNEKFTANAPVDVVAGVRETLANLQKQLASVEEVIRDLS